MEIMIGFILSFLLLIVGVLRGIFIGYPLMISFLMFSIIYVRKGHTLKELSKTAWDGGKRSFVVLRIFVLIGLITATWLVAGTIPGIVYYSLKIMNPKYYIVFAFLTSSLVSYMLGTSTGTGSTIGVVLIIMAKGGGVNLSLAGGAILSGCYVGDRMSPMSSCANLVSNLTGTEIYPMLKNFRKTAYLPLIIVSFIYLMFSFSNPLDMGGSNILNDLSSSFNISFIILIPALIMLILSTLQVNVKKAMIISILSGIVIALWIQSVTLLSLIKTLLIGYKLGPDHPLVSILKGGGLFSMLKPSIVIFVSCAMAGILEGLKIFDEVSKLFYKSKDRKALFLSTGIVSLFTGAFGGNQSISLVMTNGIMNKVYKHLEVDNYGLATDMSNTAVLFSPMIPWNIANILISTIMGVNPVKIVPYAFYLFIPFIVNYIIYSRKSYS